MAYRNNNNRRGGGGGSGGGGGGSGGGGGGGGGGSSSNFGNNYGNRINPWDAGVGGVRVNNDALSFANSLINNLLGNQNANHQVPSLLDGVQSSRFDDMNGYNFIRVSVTSRIFSVLFCTNIQFFFFVELDSFLFSREFTFY